MRDKNGTAIRRGDTLLQEMVQDGKTCYKRWKVLAINEGSMDLVPAGKIHETVTDSSDYLLYSRTEKAPAAAITRRPRGERGQCLRCGEKQAAGGYRGRYCEECYPIHQRERKNRAAPIPTVEDLEELDNSRAEAFAEMTATAELED